MEKLPKEGHQGSSCLPQLLITTRASKVEKLKVTKPHRLQHFLAKSCLVARMLKKGHKALSPAQGRGRAPATPWSAGATETERRRRPKALRNAQSHQASFQQIKKAPSPPDNSPLLQNLALVPQHRGAPLRPLAADATPTGGSKTMICQDFPHPGAAPPPLSPLLQQGCQE